MERPEYFYILETDLKTAVSELSTLSFDERSSESLFAASVAAMRKRIIKEESEADQCLIVSPEHTSSGLYRGREF